MGHMLATRKASFAESKFAHLTSRSSPLFPVWKTAYGRFSGLDPSEGPQHTSQQLANNLTAADLHSLTCQSAANDKGAYHSLWAATVTNGMSSFSPHASPSCGATVTALTQVERKSETIGTSPAEDGSLLWEFSFNLASDS